MYFRFIYISFCRLAVMSEAECKYLRESHEVRKPCKIYKKKAMPRHKTRSNN